MKKPGEVTKQHGQPQKSWRGFRTVLDKCREWWTAKQKSHFQYLSASVSAPWPPPATRESAECCLVQEIQGREKSITFKYGEPHFLIINSFCCLWLIKYNKPLMCNTFVKLPQVLNWLCFICAEILHISTKFNLLSNSVYSTTVGYMLDMSVVVIGTVDGN